MEDQNYNTVQHHRLDGNGRNHGWKVDGDQGLGPNTGALFVTCCPANSLKEELQPTGWTVKK